MMLSRSDVRAGLARLTALGLSFDAWMYHPQLPDIIDLARACPERQYHHVSRGRAARLWSLCRQEGRGVCRLEGVGSPSWPNARTCR